MLGNALQYAIEFIWQSNGDLWLCLLGFYVFELGWTTRFLRSASLLYEQGLVHLRSPRLVTSTSAFSPSSMSHSMSYGIGLRSIGELASISSGGFGMDRAYFVQLFRSGANYELAFREDLKNFLLLWHNHLGRMKFVRQTIISLAMVAFLLWLLSFFFQGTAWNFRGMIMAMFVIQLGYVSLAKHASIKSFRKDLLAGVPASTRKESVKSFLEALFSYQRVLQEVVCEYWRSRADYHQSYHQQSLVGERELSMISEMFTDQNAMRQAYSLVHVLEATAMIGVFFVQNFAMTP